MSGHTLIECIKIPNPFENRNWEEEEDTTESMDINDKE